MKKLLIFTSLYFAGLFGAFAQLQENAYNIRNNVANTNWLWNENGKLVHKTLSIKTAHWELEQDGEAWRIVDLQSRRHLTANVGAQKTVFLENADQGKNTQKWRYKKEGGYYKLYTSNQGKTYYLGIGDKGKLNLVLMEEYQIKDKNCFLWKFELASHPIPKPTIYSVIVGVAQYPTAEKVNSQNYPRDDARAMKGFLQSPQGGLVKEENIKLLLDQYATKEAILDVLRTSAARAKEHDVLIFYFSGHGEENSFIPYDYTATDSKSLLAHTEVQAIMDSSPAKHKLCIADACFAGSAEKNCHRCQKCKRHT